MFAIFILMKKLFPVLENVYVVVQFYPWFKFDFPLFQTHYHTLQYPKNKRKQNLNQG